MVLWVYTYFKTPSLSKVDVDHYEHQRPKSVIKVINCANNYYICHSYQSVTMTTLPLSGTVANTITVEFTYWNPVNWKNIFKWKRSASRYCSLPEIPINQIPIKWIPRAATIVRYINIITIIMIMIIIQFTMSCPLTIAVKLAYNDTAYSSNKVVTGL